MVLAMAMKRAVQVGHIARSPVDLVAPPPRDSEGQRRSLSPVEVARFLRAARSSPIYPHVAVALAGGLRRGEVLGLDWSSVDLDRGTIHVTQQYSRGVAGFELKAGTKSGRSRTVALPSIALEALRAMPGRDGLVFLNGQGRPLDPRELVRGYKSILKAASLPDLPFHTLRHSTATLAHMAGVSTREVQAALGHRSITTTEVYSHVLPGMAAESAAKLDALLRRLEGAA
jgi:integrase